MEDNTQNEQTLNLDEEQLQNITGGAVDHVAASQANQAYQQYQNLLQRSRENFSAGNHDAAQQALRLAGVQQKRYRFFRSKAAGI
jgi:hypothetical protein